MYSNAMPRPRSGRLGEPTYFIVAALLGGPLHGYGIVRRVAELTDGRVRITAGTLYGALDRLVADGLVERDREEVVAGRPRRYYHITDEGNARVRAEARTLRSAADIVEGVPLRARVRPA